MDFDIQEILISANDKWEEHEAAGNTGPVEILTRLPHHEALALRNELNKVNSPFTFSVASQYLGWGLFAHA